MIRFRSNQVDSSRPDLSIALDRSRSEAAVSLERREVRGLIEEPEAFPIVAGLAKVFRVDEQLLDAPGGIGRVVRQGDRGATFADREEGPDQEQGRQGLSHSRVSSHLSVDLVGSSRRRSFARPRLDPVSGLPRHPSRNLGRGSSVFRRSSSLNSLRRRPERRIRRWEARRPAERSRHPLNRHLHRRPIVEVSRDSSFGPNLPSLYRV